MPQPLIIQVNLPGLTADDVVGATVDTSAATVVGTLVALGVTPGEVVGADAGGADVPQATASNRVSTNPAGNSSIGFVRSVARKHKTFPPGTEIQSDLR